MPEENETQVDTRPQRRRRRRVLRVLSLILLCAGGLGLLLLGLDRLPAVFVDVSDIPDPSARAEALNAARTPVGVVMAALLGGSAATFGVLTTRRSLALTDKSLAITEQTIALARAKNVSDEKQWKQDHLTKRLQDATTALGSSLPAIRLTGVSSLTSLAEEEEDWKWRCIEALESYLSLPEEEGEPRTRAESRVRQAIWRAIADNTQRNRGSGGPWSRRGWSFQDVDVREDVKIQNSLVSSFGLQGVRFSSCKFSAGFTLESRATLEDVTVAEQSEVLIGLLGDFSYATMSNLVIRSSSKLLVAFEAIGLACDDRNHGHVDVSDVSVIDGGIFVLGIDADEEVDNQRFVLPKLHLDEGRMELLAEGRHGDCTVVLKDVRVTKDGSIFVDRRTDNQPSWRIEGNVDGTSMQGLAFCVQTATDTREVARIAPGRQFAATIAAGSALLEFD